MASLRLYPKSQYPFTPVIHQTQIISRIENQASRTGEPSVRIEAKPIPDQFSIRMIAIFSSVIIFSILSAWIGCVIATYHGKRRRILHMEKNTMDPEMLDRAPARNSVALSTDSSHETEIEMLAQLNDIMANESFKGREWDDYKREVRLKARRQARGALRTSQGIALPTNVKTIQRRISALPRSLIRSLTKSDPFATTENVVLDEILANMKSITPETISSEGTSGPSV